MPNNREKRQTKPRGQLTAAGEMIEISFKTIFTSKLKRACQDTVGEKTSFRHADASFF